ncbi:MAG: aminotransferase class IV [Chloroflexi bacterium]|nr:aminotransferase class IV [Chloroflexota bacterium]
MTIQFFQINKARATRLQMPGSTLDEATRSLPQGFYTTFCTHSGGSKVLGLHAHLDRLYGPAREVGIIPSVDSQALRKRIADLAAINLPQESRIRLILAKVSGIVYVGIQPFEPLSKAIYEKGVKVASAELIRRSPRIKDSAFISSSRNQRSQVQGDIFEVLLTKDGRILEGMTSNFYAIIKNTLVTSQRGILLGVTRRAILRQARGQGMQIQYRPPALDEKFDEAFLTSSSRGVVPITTIDGRKVGEGRVGKWTNRLSKAYQTYVEERSEELI